MSLSLGFILIFGLQGQSPTAEDSTRDFVYYAGHAARYRPPSSDQPQGRFSADGPLNRVEQNSQGLVITCKAISGLTRQKKSGGLNLDEVTGSGNVVVTLDSDRSIGYAKAHQLKTTDQPGALSTLRSQKATFSQGASEDKVSLPVAFETTDHRTQTESSGPTSSLSTVTGSSGVFYYQVPTDAGRGRLKTADVQGPVHLHQIKKDLANDQNSKEYDIVGDHLTQSQGPDSGKIVLDGHVKWQVIGKQGENGVSDRVVATTDGDGKITDIETFQTSNPDEVTAADSLGDVSLKLGGGGTVHMPTSDHYSFNGPGPQVSVIENSQGLSLSSNTASGDLTHLPGSSTNLDSLLAEGNVVADYSSNRAIEYANSHQLTSTDPPGVSTRVTSSTMLFNQGSEIDKLTLRNPFVMTDERPSKSIKEGHDSSSIEGKSGVVNFAAPKKGTKARLKDADVDGPVHFHQIESYPDPQTGALMTTVYDVVGDHLTANQDADHGSLELTGHVRFSSSQDESSGHCTRFQAFTDGDGNILRTKMDNVVSQSRPIPIPATGGSPR